MTWSLQSPFEEPQEEFRIKPDRVLYSFDGPQLFAARFGFLDSIFVKVDDADKSYFWVATVTDVKTLEAVVADRLSVRGAFLRERCWIIETDFSMSVLRFWSVKTGELPEGMLPSPGVALSASADRVPDTIEQANAYFAMAFKGEAVSTGHMPFAALKQLIDNAYDSARKVLGPTVLRGSKSSTYDFMVELTVGSLILSIDAPIMERSKVMRKLASNETTYDDVQNQMALQRDDFFANLRTAVESVDGKSSAVMLSEAQQSTIRQVEVIIPDEGDFYGSIEFSAKIKGEVRSIIINQGTGKKIHRAINKEHHQRAVRVGMIVETNPESGTFLLRLANGNKNTCVVTPEVAERLDVRKLSYGIIMSVRGFIERRPRRDLVYVSDFEIVEDDLEDEFG